MKVNWSVVGIIASILLALFVPGIGMAVTWGSLGNRIQSVEHWQERRETLDADIAVMKAQLQSIDKQLDAMSGSIGRIVERSDRNNGQPVP